MPPTEPYLRYVTNPTIQDVFHKFNTIYDKIFPKTPCSHCGELKVDAEVKWCEFDPWNDYTLWTWLSTPLHIRRIRGGQREVALCEGCTKKPKAPPTSGPWPEELLCLEQRSRPFLSPIILTTNLGRTTGAGDNVDHQYTYRTLTGWSVFLS